MCSLAPMDTAVAGPSLLPQRYSDEPDAGEPPPQTTELRRTKSKHRSSERRSSERRKRGANVAPMSAEEYLRRRDQFQEIAIELQRLIGADMGVELQTQLVYKTHFQ